MKMVMIALLAGVSQPAIGQTMKMPNGQTMTMPTPPKPTTAKKKVPEPKTAKPAPQKAKPKPKAAPATKKPVMDHSMMDHDQKDSMPAPSAADPAEAMGEDAMAAMPMDRETADDSAQEAGAMDHSAMDMSGGDMIDMDMSGDQMDSMDMSGGDQMDGMDMSSDDMDGMDMAMPMADAPPPPEAGSGPARAANVIWGADAMRASRAQLAKENGGQTLYWVMADRAEYRVRDGKNGYLWDAQGFYGGDIDKLWIKTEGEGKFGGTIEDAEVQALWSHAIAPFFDFQGGVRQDFAVRDRTYAVGGVQGLLPYVFEIDAAAFFSDKGDLTARFEGEYDQRITQRLILQPRIEVNLAAQDVPELGIGAGIDTIETGLRLRYEITREFGPYIGISQEWKLGRSADYARADGEDPSVTNYVVGVRFWF